MKTQIVNIETGETILRDMTAAEVADFLATQPPRDYAAEVKANRDAALAAGITVGGVAVQTDDLSQQRILGAAVAAMLDPNMTVNWKAAAGQFVTLNAPTILALASAVRAHVQACFDREAALMAELASATDPAAVDVASGWPGGVQ